MKLCRNVIFLIAFFITVFGFVNAQEFKEVKIGNQVWMAENLNVFYFKNGDPIPQAQTEEEWKFAAIYKLPAWCYCKNETTYGYIYKKLYNWYAVNDPRGIAPEGWHIPTVSEWMDLDYFLGAEAGNKMKSTNGWSAFTSRGFKTCPNCASWNKEYRSKVPCHICKDTREVPEPKLLLSGNGSNSSGFSGLPGGYCNDSGLFLLVGLSGTFWSSTGFGVKEAYYRCLNYENMNIIRGKGSKGSGMSVRCIKD